MGLWMLILSAHVISTLGATPFGKSQFSQLSAEQLLPSKGTGGPDSLTDNPNAEQGQRSKNSAGQKPASGNGQVIIQTDNGPKIVSNSEYIATLKANIANNIKGLPSQNLKDIQSLFVCTLPDQPAPVFYDSRLFICCQGLFNRTSPSQICCGKEVVDSEQYFCCSNKIHSKSDTNHTLCCGDRTYDSMMHICCNGQLYERGSNSACCNSELYDNRTQLCCYDMSVFNMSAGDSCCGLGVYHSANETCCLGMVQRAYGRRNNRGRCCRDFSYDARCHSCDAESGRVIPLYDINKRICCDGQIRKRRWPLTECCGRKTIDASNFTCVNDSIQPKSLPTTFSSFIIYNRSYSTGGHLLNNTNPLPSFPGSNIDADIKIVVVFGSGLFVFVIVVVVVHKISQRQLKQNSCKLPPVSSHNETVPMLNDHRQYNNQYRPQQNRHHMSDFTGVSVSPSTKSKASRIEVTMPMEDATSQFDCFMVYQDIDKHALSKYMEHVYINDYDNLQTDSSTQTFAPKECNLLTVFGRPFAHTYMIDARNPTVHMPESEEKMTLSKEALQDGAIETHCSTFWNIEEIMRKFAIPKDETIASPVAEYDVTGYSAGMPGYNVVIKPFLGRARDLKVYKFKSDQGINPTGELIPVPPKDKQNEDMDMYYEIEGKYVYIYTKSFSGFLCTTCKHSRNLRLTAFLYGSYKEHQTHQLDYKYEVRLKLYIADELLNFKDYQQEMDRKEQNEGRTRQTEPQLELLDVLTPDDELEFMLTCMGPEGTWAPKLRPNKEPIFPDIQTIKLKDVAEQCQDCPNMHCERNLPKHIEWYLVNVGGRKPEATFQCIVDVLCKAVSEESRSSQAEREKRSQPVIVDELRCPNTPKPYHVEDDRSLTEITVFLNNMEIQKKQHLMTDISDRNQIRSNSFEDLFAKMKNKYKVDGVVEEIVRGLERCSMHMEIGRLSERQLLPHSLAKKPTQTAPSNYFEGAACKPSETTSLLHDRNSQITGPRCAERGFKEPGSNRSVSENDLVCRREMSRAVFSSFNGYGPPGFLPADMVRPEIGDTAPSQGQAGFVGGMAPEVPVQEVASMDETLVMKIDKDPEV